LKTLNGGRYEAAREQLLRWDLAGGEVNAGLKTRRDAEFQLWARERNMRKLLKRSRGNSNEGKSRRSDAQLDESDR
jgi:hypothetical protein